MSFRAKDTDDGGTGDPDAGGEDGGSGGDVHSTTLHMTDGRGSTSVTTSRMIVARWAVVEASNHFDKRTLPCREMSIIQCI